MLTIQYKYGADAPQLNVISKVLIVFITCINLSLYGQSDSVLYTPDFKFVEGVYLDFSDVVKNSPIPKARVISGVDYNDNEYFEKVLSKSQFYIIDNVGNKVAIKTSKLWGYSRNGFLYKNIDDGFYRITLVGSCSHFVAYKTYEVSNGYAGYSYYQYPYSGYPNTVSTQTEMQQYLLDFKTGRIVEYNVEGIELILMNDPVLHDEYMQLSKKKKKQLKFVFIRKYNHRNPLYLLKTKII